ncbi:MAG: hypothetical protein MHM6MM_000355 [Cercozoa sp. M6MM]
MLRRLALRSSLLLRQQSRNVSAEEAQALATLANLDLSLDETLERSPLRRRPARRQKRKEEKPRLPRLGVRTVIDGVAANQGLPAAKEYILLDTANTLLLRSDNLEEVINAAVKSGGDAVFKSSSSKNKKAAKSFKQKEEEEEKVLHDAATLDFEEIVPGKHHHHKVTTDEVVYEADEREHPSRNIHLQPPKSEEELVVDQMGAVDTCVAQVKVPLEEVNSENIRDLRMTSRTGRNEAELMLLKVHKHLRKKKCHEVTLTIDSGKGREIGKNMRRPNDAPGASDGVHLSEIVLRDYLAPDLFGIDALANATGVVKDNQLGPEEFPLREIKVLGNGHVTFFFRKGAELHGVKRKAAITKALERIQQVYPAVMMQAWNQLGRQGKASANFKHSVEFFFKNGQMTMRQVVHDRNERRNSKGRTNTRNAKLNQAISHSSDHESDDVDREDSADRSMDVE